MIAHRTDRRDREEHSPDVRMVTVAGEVDTVTMPASVDVLTAQLAAAQLVVVDLDRCATLRIFRMARVVQGTRACCGKSAARAYDPAGRASK
jgi:hypothetical protein